MNLTFKPHAFNVRTLCEGVCSRMCAVYYETRVSGSMRCRCNTCAFNVHKLCEGVHARVVCTVYYEVCVWLRAPRVAKAIRV